MVLVEHVSEPLEDILRGHDALGPPNLTAEFVGLLATQAGAASAPASLTESAGEMSAWICATASLGAEQAAYAHHSGVTATRATLRASDIG